MGFDHRKEKQDSKGTSLIKKLTSSETDYSILTRVRLYSVHTQAVQSSSYSSYVLYTSIVSCLCSVNNNYHFGMSVLQATGEINRGGRISVNRR